MKNKYNFQDYMQFSREFTKLINQGLSKHGLFSGQWPIIYFLKREGASSQARICDYLGVEAPTMTRTIKRLESNELVERIPGKDKRERLIILTDKAEALYPLWKKEVNEVEAKILQGITEEEQVTIQKSLDKMIQNIKEGRF